MNKETADLVDLQELFEMAGPSIFFDDFDVPGFIASIKNQDGVLVSPRFDFSECAFRGSQVDSRWKAGFECHFNLKENFFHALSECTQKYSYILQLLVLNLS